MHNGGGALQVILELGFDRVTIMAEADVAVVDLAHLPAASGGDRVVVVLAGGEQEADDAVDAGVDLVVVAGHDGPCAAR